MGPPGCGGAGPESGWPGPGGEGCRRRQRSKPGPVTRPTGCPGLTDNLNSRTRLGDPGLPSAASSRRHLGCDLAYEAHRRVSSLRHGWFQPQEEPCGDNSRESRQGQQICPENQPAFRSSHKAQRPARTTRLQLENGDGGQEGSGAAKAARKPATR